jgi:hypothetical protein
MSLNVTVPSGTYEFDGPYTAASSLPAASGVYVISTKEPAGTYTVLDVGESADVQDRVSNHDRADSWIEHKKDRIYMSAYKCEEKTRMSLEGEIRAQYKPPCGDR